MSRVSSHHHGRAQIADFISPDNGFRGTQKRMGVQPKDFMKENRATIRSAQLRNREEREEAARMPKELYKLQQFRDIKPRYGQQQQQQPPNSSRSQRQQHGDNDENDDNYDGGFDEDNYGQSASNSAGGYNDYSTSGGAFVRKGDSAKRREELMRMRHESRKELEAKMEDARWIANRPSTPRKAPTPKATEVAALAPRTGADFISRNRAKALTLVPPPPRRTTDKEPELHEDFGKVPDYLEERKAKWAEEKEEMKKRMPDPSCPRGMTLMPEEERVSTLEVLKASKEEAMKQLAKMPFVIETPSLKKRHGELEAKLREIESAIALFSKTKVFIALDR